MKRLPETNPDIEQAEAATESTEKSVGNDAAKRGEREQQIIVSPFRGPRKNYEQHSGDSTDQYKQEYRDAMHPDLQGTLRRVGLRIQRQPNNRVLRISRRWRRLWCLAGRIGKKGGIAHSGQLRRRETPRKS